MSESVTATAVAVPAPTKRCRVLVVEDDEDSATLLTLLLERLGYEAQFAHDALSALAVARVWEPRVVLLDLGLPGMSGYDLATALRAQSDGRELRLIALTGFSGDETRRRALEAGCESHLVKGVDLETLLATIEGDEVARCAL